MRLCAIFAPIKEVNHDGESEKFLARFWEVGGIVLARFRKCPKFLGSWHVISKNNLEAEYYWKLIQLKFKREISKLLT